MSDFRSLFLAAGLACVVTDASAHPVPRAAAPKPDAIITTSPAEIRITFSEALVVAFSGLEVDDAKGTGIATGDATLNPADDKELVVPLKAKLAPGSYIVKWHVVGTDTHRVAGHYSFQVKV